jgi:hypothetical protein
MLVVTEGATTSLDTGGTGGVGTSEVVVVPDVVSGTIGVEVGCVHEARLVRVAASIIPANRRFFIRKEYKIKYRYYIDFKKESKKVLKKQYIYRKFEFELSINNKKRA